MLPGFALPWTLPGGDGAPVGLSYALLRNLIGPAFAIAMLAALESLLCAVVADGMSGKRHDPNDELIGQGLGNMIVPFFGGIPAPAAIARTAANVAPGHHTAGVRRAPLFILLSILVPRRCWLCAHGVHRHAALVVAWNMSEGAISARILKVAPGRDIFTLLNCFGLTVLFDMQIAIAVGMGLAAVLFVRRSIELTGVELIEHAHNEHPRSRELPSSVLVYDINGAMFFGSAQKVLRALTSVPGDVEAVILEMSDVNMLDMTGMVALESILAHFRKSGIRAVINDLTHLIRKLDKVGIREERASSASGHGRSRGRHAGGVGGTASGWPLSSNPEQSAPNQPVAALKFQREPRVPPSSSAAPPQRLVGARRQKSANSQ